MEFANIAFIGAGNMASSLIYGLIQDNYPQEKIWASNHDQQKADALRERMQVHTTTDNKVAVESADVIVFAVKPQTLKAVLTDVAPVIHRKKPLIISIAAGVRISSLETMLGEDHSVVRCMPNTPALVGNAATGMFANERVSIEQRDLAESILRAVGVVVWLDQETELDIVTALSGSGPAYFFMIMEALIAAATEEGLSEATARLLTLQTAVGAAHMALQSDGDIAQLRRQVTSPGGTTEKALQILEKGRLRQVFARAIAAATKRATELAGEF